MSKKRKPDNRDDRPDRSSIYVAIIGLIAAVSVAVIGIINARVPIEIPIRATQTAEAQLTPIRGTLFTQSLTPNQVMFVSSGQFQIGDSYCGQAADMICVLLYEATITQTVQVTSLDPQHYFVDVVNNRLPQDVLDTQKPLFWEPPNCTVGCERATFMIFKDSQLVRQDTISR